jgi:integrase
MRHNGVVIDAKAGQISVRAYADAWLQTVRAVKREETYRQYESHIRVHVLPALGGKQLRNVTRADVQTFTDRLSATLAPRTVRAIHDIVQQLFRRATVLDKRIPASPCVGIELPEIPHQPVQVLTPDQVRTLADTVPGPYRAAVLIAAGTGLRISEVAGLTWDRIDLDAGTLTVDRQMSARRTLVPPKTKRSRRVVPIPQMVHDALLAHRAAYLAPTDSPGRDRSLDASDGVTGVHPRR